MKVSSDVCAAEARQRAHRATADGARNFGRTTGPLQQTAPAFDPIVSPNCPGANTSSHCPVFNMHRAR